jgi:hypothetical protein
MKEIDVQKEALDEVELLGHMALFTELRVDKSTLPKDMYCYELRHGDDNSFPATLEKNVTVNYFGAIILPEELELEAGRLKVPYEEFSFTGKRMKLKEFQKKSKQEEPKLIQTAKDLVEFLDSNDILFPMTVKEAEVLLGYMGGHGYLLGEQEGRLFRGDLNYAQNNSQTEDFFSVTRGLRSDTDLGFFAADYGGQQKRDYNYEEFYKASTDKKADIFVCMENGKAYVPCGYELQEYVKEVSKAMPERGKTR